MDDDRSRGTLPCGLFVLIGPSAVICHCSSVEELRIFCCKSGIIDEKVAVKARLEAERFLVFQDALREMSSGAIEAEVVVRDEIAIVSS